MSAFAFNVFAQTCSRPTSSHDLYTTSSPKCRRGCKVVIEDIGKTVKELQELFKGGRLQFSFQKNERDRLLERLQRNNDNLFHFMEHREHKVNLQVRQTDGSGLDMLKKMRQKLSNLYDSPGKGFNCSTGLSPPS